MSTDYSERIAELFMRGARTASTRGPILLYAVD